MWVVKERYIGDGVYVSFDGYHIWLDTRAQAPVNRIAMEPQVLAGFEQFVADLRASLPPDAEEEDDGNDDS